MADAAGVPFAGAPERGRALLNGWAGQRPAFCCVLAHTDTCLIPGVSAAGRTEALRPLTPAADAEVVLRGAPVCMPTLPSNPGGAPGPAGITRAALQLAAIPASFIATGLPHWPATDCRRIPGPAGGNIEHGHAVPNARQLFAAGEQLGGELAGTAAYLVLAESVPGGTTTALALLLALGIDAAGRVSGSLPGNAHALKAEIAHSALRAARLQPGDGQADPLGAVGEIGDPMQPLACGILIGAARRSMPVLLAGGSQMLAVAALGLAVAGSEALACAALGTTRWVVHDPAADIVGLATDIAPHLPVIAANLNFSASRHLALHLYEDFLVKEGVGAGGASMAALLTTGCSLADLHLAIDDAYAGLLAEPSRKIG